MTASPITASYRGRQFGFLDNTDSDCRQDDNQTERESPSPPPPSPSSPPIAHQPVGERQCVVDVKGVTHCVGLPPPAARSTTLGLRHG